MLMSALSYVSLSSLMLFSLMLMLENRLPDKVVSNGELVYDHTADSEVHRRSVCVSNSLGISPSFERSGCVGDNCKNVTCDKLFAGDAAAIKVAQLYQRKSPSDDAEVYKLATECSRLRHLGEYQMTPVRATDVDFPIAFTILVHFNAEQFERLLRALYRPQNVYCIHVDTKSPTSFQAAVKAITNCFHNVFLATRLHHVVYAGPSRLQVDQKIILSI